MDLLRTQQTYLTRENAIKALEARVGKERLKELQWIIAVNEKGRFAPVVRVRPDQRKNGQHDFDVIHAGITII